ncbi:MAG: amidohydrolase family protein [Acidimicrobiales bacterium]|nr:amidohydrolase family protein [Acidimicrobiales bacterium]
MTEPVPAGRPARIVDAHVHLWDPARTDWYPYLSGGMQLDLGDVRGMARRFDVPTYRAESQGWNVEKLVNVAAATGAQSVDETLALDAAAAVTGQPAAIVGGITPAAGTAEVIAQIDRQLAAPRFRGVRPMGAVADPVPERAVLEALRDRGLVFDLMAHTHQLAAAADALAAVDGLTVVVEHTGWPRSDTAEEFAEWRGGLAALADIGDRVVCKLSGLAMPLGAMTADAFAPWLEHAIGTFGPDRCMFASNFPVDGLHGTLDELFTAYHTVTAGLDPTARDALFAGTAERVYRC